ncbi:hypothetical protein MRB53_026040 [Persea americana]|uniref:Uncharacterized protein n=1 Tax=Persea americana TaxID=3435 RepID=A0ACC2LH03_PERAE|nr:hypothetical protein MRB53_026040 [Persea americana]
MMAGFNPNSVTTDMIQQYLDENKQLILQILDSQSSGKLGDCAENQARLQRNLMYLATIADSQPQPSPSYAQFPSNATMQPGACYMQHQQAQQMTPQSLMAAPSSMLYGQQSLSTLQQQSLHGQLGMSSGVNNGLHLLQGETGVVTTRGFPDFGRNSGEVLQLASRGLMGGVKQEPGNGVSLEARGGHNADGPETLYLKVPGEGN